MFREGGLPKPAKEFTSFMDPGISWIAPAEYAAAFDGLIGDGELADLAATRAADGEKSSCVTSPLPPPTA
jgi:hypothetical protein